MPTRPLPLLRALLCALEIPLDPPTLQSVPPSLLLLVLETILQTRFPLPSQTRNCADEASELELVKIILGVLADDELGMDMTVVDPLRVVRGLEMEMSVVVMALVVVAKRRGISVKLPEEGQRDLLSDEEWKGGSTWEQPLRPDYSWSSQRRRTTNKDVFVESDSLGDAQGAGEDTSLDADSSALEFDPYLTPVKYDRELHHETHDIPQLCDMPAEQSTRNTTSSTARRRRTVLQDMMDEFGLG